MRAAVGRPAPSTRESREAMRKALRTAAAVAACLGRRPKGRVEKGVLLGSKRGEEGVEVGRAVASCALPVAALLAATDTD